MKQIDVTARLGKDGTPATVKFNMGDNVQEVAKQLGEEITYNQLRGAVIVSLQAFMRAKMGAEKPVTGKELQEAVNQWKPGIRQPGKPPAEKVKDLFAKLSDADRKALLKELRG